MPECITVFILPPSVEELERRLRDRRTDAPEVIERRLRDALSDMSHWDEFDYVIINDDLDTAVADLEAVLAGEGEACSTGNDALRRSVARIVG
jgi:guanylate kinase